MTKTYLIDEEVLRQVLEVIDNVIADWDDMTITPDKLKAVTTLRTILSSPPAEPVAWAWRPNDKWGWSFDMRGLAVGLPDGYEYVPLYRKDAP